MSAKDMLRSLLYGEVDDVERGLDHRLSMKERREERARERQKLRSEVTTHPDLKKAVVRRLRAM